MRIILQDDNLNLTRLPLQTEADELYDSRIPMERAHYGLPPECYLLSGNLDGEAV